ncbi:MAG: hypothetical protein Q7S87_09945 [Agitococcus sp.]|nr:hypothetical protein [Agitococcus sp.]
MKELAQAQLAAVSGGIWDQTNDDGCNDLSHLSLEELMQVEVA